MLQELLLNLSLEGLLIPIIAEMIISLVTIGFVRQDTERSFFKKTQRVIVGLCFFVIASIGVFTVYIWDEVNTEVKMSMTSKVKNFLHLEKEVFYSLENNVVQTTESEIVRHILSNPNENHLIFNPSTNTWNSWKTYPNISIKVYEHRPK